MVDNLYFYYGCFNYIYVFINCFFFEPLLSISDKQMFHLLGKHLSYTCRSIWQLESNFQPQNSQSNKNMTRSNPAAGICFGG